MSLIAYDPQKHAQLIASYCLYAQAGERILLAGSVIALPLLREIHREMLKLGARPVLRMSYEGQDAETCNLASDEVLDHVHPAEIDDMKTFDGFMRVLCPENRNTADADRRARLQASRSALLAARKDKKWSLSLYPSEVAARQAQLPQAEFDDFVMRAMFLDRADPVAEWGRIRELQATLIERLSRADTIQIQNAGTDIRLRTGGRIWANSDGKRNMPSGEVFTSPIEDSANGYITFDIPALYGGVMVRNVRLEFKDGKVIKASADEGEEVLLAALETDQGARFLGEIGIGSNSGIQRPTGNILFDEKIGGTAHLALGRSYPETGGLNASAIHWDLITDLRQGGRILLDGEVWQENGVFR